MALSIVSAQTGIATGTNSVVTSGNVNDTNSADIIIAIIGAEWNSTSLVGSVSGVSGGGLTWQKRSGFQYYGGRGYADFEIWWAYAAGAFNATVTATFSLPSSTNFDDAAIVAFGVHGFTGSIYPTAPWDTQGALPATATAPLLSNGNPTLNISSVCSAGMIIGALANTINNSGVTPGSGYTSIATATQAGGVLDMVLLSEQATFSSPLASQTVNWSSSSLNYWLMIADVLSQTGAVPALPETFADGISFKAASAGTGYFVFGSARQSFLTPAQAVTAGELVDGQTVSYLAQDSLIAPTQREWGHGTFHSAGNGSITRTTVLGAVNYNAAGASKLNFAVPPYVSLVPLGEDLIAPQASTPASYTSAGTPFTFAIDGTGNLYICDAPSTWAKFANAQPLGGQSDPIPFFY